MIAGDTFDRPSPVVWSPPGTGAPFSSPPDGFDASPPPSAGATPPTSSDPCGFCRSPPSSPTSTACAMPRPCWRAVPAGLRDAALRGDERQVTRRALGERQHVERVDADALRVAAVRRVPAPGRDGDGVGADADVRICRRRDAAGGGGDREMVALGDAEALRGRRMDLDPRLPRDLRDRVRDLLQ